MYKIECLSIFILLLFLLENILPLDLATKFTENYCYKSNCESITLNVHTPYQWNVVIMIQCNISQALYNLQLVLPYSFA